METKMSKRPDPEHNSNEAIKLMSPGGSIADTGEHDPEQGLPHPVSPSSDQLSLAQQYATTAVAVLLRDYIDEHYPGMNDIDAGTREYLAGSEIHLATVLIDSAVPMTIDMEHAVAVDCDDWLACGEIALSRTDTVSWSLLENGIGPFDGEDEPWLAAECSDSPPASLAVNPVAAFLD